MDGSVGPRSGDRMAPSIHAPPRAQEGGDTIITHSLPLFALGWLDTSIISIIFITGIAVPGMTGYVYHSTMYFMFYR